MITLSEALNQFLQVDRSAYTNKMYANVLNQMVSAIGADVPVDQITPPVLSQWWNTLPTRTRKGKPIKSITLQTYLRVLTSFFNFCVKSGLLSSSPADNIKVRVVQSQQGRKSKAIPPDELAAIIDVARRKYNPRDYAIVLFLADTGCRVGGLESLTLDHLDLDGCTADLFEKGSKWHKVYFGKSTQAALRAWLKERPPAQHNYVFTQSEGRGAIRLTRTTLGHVIEELAKKAKCSRVWRPHAIRHALGHLMAESGVAPSIAAQKLGHANPTVTMMHYYPNDETAVRDMSERVSLVKETPQAAGPEPTNGKIIQVDWRDAG